MERPLLIGALMLIGVISAQAQAQTQRQQQGALSNPYMFNWPPGNVYPDYDPLAKSILFAPDNTIAVTNQLAYGNLNTASAAAFSINSNRPAGINGYTGDNQIGDIQEIGAMALSVQADSIPYLFEAAGSFTSTAFTPRVSLASQSVIYPFGTTTKATALSLLKPNMWLTTDDPVPYFGRVTNVGDGGTVTVAGWYRLGSIVAGTPAGTKIYANPQNYAWSYLPELFLNPLGRSISGRFTKPTGTVSAGSKTITSVSDTTGVIKGQLITGDGIPPGAAITGYTSNTITISAAATATHAATPLNISAFIGNAGAISEFDLKNDGPAFSPLTPVTVTGCRSVKDSMTLTGCSAIPDSVREGHAIFTTSPAVRPGSTVVSVASPNGITLNHPATQTANGISLTFYSAFYEGGVGIDMSAIANNSASAYSERGNFSYGYTSFGAGDTSFLVMPNGYAALPAYGFRVDKSLLGPPSKAPFALTQNGYDVWKVDGNGTTYAPAAVYYGAQHGAVAIRPAADSETYNFNLPKMAGAPGQVLTSRGGQAPMTWTTPASLAADAGPWTPYTPSLGCGSGRLASASASGRYKTIGKSTLISLSITIGANGTCASYLTASLPDTANSPAVFAGRDAGRGGVMVQGFADAAQASMTIQRYDAAYPAASGSGLRLSGVYENR